MEIYNTFNVTAMDYFISRDLIQTDPELMRQKAAVVQIKISQMKNAFDSLEYAVNHTKSYWAGEAGDVYRENLKHKKTDIDTILSRLSEYVSDLQQMAAVYAGVEKEVEELAQDLPADVIC